MKGRLEGRVAVVTGAGKGIGRADALLFAAEGAAVVVCDMGVVDGLASADRVVEEIHAMGGRAAAYLGDLGSFAGGAAAVDRALEAFGRVDILVNNAGLRAAGAIEEIDEAGYERVVSSHLTATFATIRRAVPRFVDQGGGVIVNTGSEAGLGHAYNSAYAAAKEAIAGLTRTIAREVGHLGVRCNQIRPRADTDRGAEFAGALEARAEDIARLGDMWMGRRGTLAIPSPPEAVAQLTVWLCTEAASGLNGRDLFVAGDRIGLFSEPEEVRTVVRPEGWDLDALDRLAGATFAAGLVDEFGAR